jgi:hypothetical protein
MYFVAGENFGYSEAFPPPQRPARVSSVIFASFRMRLACFPDSFHAAAISVAIRRSSANERGSGHPATINLPPDFRLRISSSTSLSYRPTVRNPLPDRAVTCDRRIGVSEGI